MSYGIIDQTNDAQTNEYYENQENQTESTFSDEYLCNELIPYESDLSSLLESLNDLEQRFDLEIDKEQTFVNKISEVKYLIDKAHSKILTIQKYYE